MKDRCVVAFDEKNIRSTVWPGDRKGNNLVERKVSCHPLVALDDTGYKFFEASSRQIAAKKQPVGRCERNFISMGLTLTRGKHGRAVSKSIRKDQSAGVHR